MVSLDSTELHGFSVEDYHENRRVYVLPGSESFSIGEGGSRAEIIFATASNLDRDDHGAFFTALESVHASGLEPIICVDAQFNNETPAPAERALVDALRTRGVAPSVAFPTFFDGVFDEPEYVQLMAQCDSSRALSGFIRKGLSVVAQQASQSIGAAGRHYQIAVPALLADMGAYIGRPLRSKGVPTQIVGRATHRDVTSIDALTAHPYVTAIVQANGSSFTYDQEMVALARRLTEGLSDDLEKSRAIFDWVTTNIPYGEARKSRDVDYRGALEVFHHREGVCGESAALQATLERLAGNTAFLAKIEKGTSGSTTAGRTFTVDEPHSCVAHFRPSGEVTLIDTTTPDGFGIRYTKFKIHSDDRSLARYT